MKVCSIYNSLDKNKTPVAFLLYYDKDDYYRIIIRETDHIEHLPFLFTIFLEKGIHSLNSDWSRKWVESRIVPAERQNIGQILKDCGLTFYDTYRLLIKSKGICSHDDFAVEEISVTEYSTYLHREVSIQDIVSDGEEYLVFFSNDETRKYVSDEFKLNEGQQRYLNEHQYDYRIMPGGYEINWNDVVTLDVEYLRKNGEKTDISYNYFKNFLKNNVASTSDVCEELDCTRQNVDELVKKRKLTPVLSYPKNKIFLKAEIGRRK